jgi:Type II secretion system (T2SS), protein K
MTPDGRHPRPPRHAASGGFALVIVLWVLAGLIVVAVAVATSTRVNAESVKLLRDRVRAEAAFLSASARIAVIAATGSPLSNSYNGPRGRLYVDGRLTQVAPDVWTRVQDVRGLLNLNDGASPRLQRLLRRCGAPEDSLAALADALGDYIDADQLKRLNGAEGFDYRASGDLPEPRNARLLSREELWRVKGWPAIRASWQAAGCDRFVTVRGDGLSNNNTAPQEVLLADGTDATIARGLIERRQDGPLTGVSPATADAIASGNLRLAAGGFAGKAMRIRLEAASLEWALEYELELTPDRGGGPWRTYEVRYPQQVPSKVPRGAAAPLPAVDFRPADQDRSPNDAPPRLPFGN